MCKDRKGGREDMPESSGRILVLGAYGFIGAEITHGLRASGFDVIAAGRNARQAARVLPGVPFRHAEMLKLCQAQDWMDLIRDVDSVVNCAGQLQDRSPGDLEAVHHAALAALAGACAEKGVGIVQISAAGAGPEASTEFMRSKGRGDAALLASGAKAHVLRPGLVIAQGAYGGTRLLRMLAAVPLVQPLALADAEVQCTGMSDLVEAVRAALCQRLPMGTYDLVEDRPHRLEEVLAQTRAWLGFSKAKRVVQLPGWMLAPVVFGADVLGRLGWRSPLRRTALREIGNGVRGDPEPYRLATGQGLMPLADVLKGYCAGREHRLDARMALLMPIAVAVLSLFWLASGLIGLWQLEAAAAVLVAQGWEAWLAKSSVVFWSLTDVALGGAVLWRPWATKACLGMVAVSLFYLAAASLATPAMWSDPLGPLVKIFPGILLAVITRQLLEER